MAAKLPKYLGAQEIDGLSIGTGSLVLLGPIKTTTTKLWLISKRSFSDSMDFESTNPSSLGDFEEQRMRRIYSN